MASHSLRRAWDTGVMLLILASAFEVPYSLLIGWDNPDMDAAWAWTFFGVFGVDIIVHMVMGDTAASFHDSTPPPAKQPQRALHYLRSRWFLIDFLAWLPFDLILGSLHGFTAVRTLRLTRSMHLVHTFKGLRAIEMLRVQLGRHPAYARFLLLSFLVPWLIHIHTVVLLWAERSYVGGHIKDYGSALHHIFVTLLTQDLIPVQSNVGYWVWVSTAFLALIVVATVIGNAASLLMGLDGRAIDMERRLSDWHKVFHLYPGVFDRKLQAEIIQHEQARASKYQRDLLGQANLIESLPGDLEEQVRDRLREFAGPEVSSQAHHLLNLLGGPQS